MPSTINPPADHPYVYGTKMTKAELVATLADMGYKIEPGSEYQYTNNLNPESGSWKATGLRIIEADTGLGFANINARRDANFKKLQDYRFNVSPIIGGRVYQL